MSNLLTYDQVYQQAFKKALHRRFENPELIADSFAKAYTRATELYGTDEQAGAYAVCIISGRTHLDAQAFVARCTKAFSWSTPV
jgi:hypothetical protein